MKPTGPVCPACELGDHEHSASCERDYRCACPCHAHRAVMMTTPEMRALQYEKTHRLPAQYTAPAL